jgi:hypothetical protein
VTGRPASAYAVSAVTPGRHEAVSQAHPELVWHLCQSSGIEASEAARLIDEVVHYFSETAVSFVRRRHSELQSRGLRNAEIFPLIGAELASQPVRSDPLSARQLRRLVYG